MKAYGREKPLPFYTHHKKKTPLVSSVLDNSRPKVIESDQPSNPSPTTCCLSHNRHPQKHGFPFFGGFHGNLCQPKGQHFRTPKVNSPRLHPQAFCQDPRDPATSSRCSQWTRQPLLKENVNTISCEIVFLSMTAKNKRSHNSIVFTVIARTILTPDAFSSNSFTAN